MRLWNLFFVCVLILTGVFIIEVDDFVIITHRVCQTVIMIGMSGDGGEGGGIWEENINYEHREENDGRLNNYLS